MDRREIVICATQRSGSTLLCEDLRNNELGRAEEHYLSLVAKRPNPDPARALTRIREVGTSDNGIFAVKLMGNYAAAINSVLLEQGIGRLDDRLWNSIGHYYRNATFVFIERKSILRQAVSRLIARQTGINHAVVSADATFVPGNSTIGYNTDYNAKVAYKEDELESYILDIIAENHLWQRFFADNGLKPIKVVYEEIAESAEYVRDIRRALGLPDCEIDAHRKLVKLANDKSEAFVAKFVSSRSKLPQFGMVETGVPTMPIKSPSADLSAADVVAAPKSHGRNVAELTRTVAVITRRWADTPYYEAVEQAAQTQWDKIIAPFIADAPVDYSRTLELACGHGRMTAILLGKAAHVTAVDVLQENIDFCTERFADMRHLSLVRNDGVTLEEISDASITFAFCFDSMVHFDSDVVRSYLGEFRRVLRPGGYAFCHHSNLDRQPGGDFQRAAHARNFMTERLFRHYAIKEGLLALKSRVIDWGTNEKRVEKLDCLSLIQRPGLK